MAPAPALVVDRWFNTDEPITLLGLRGRVVLLHAFQMLCPGCVAHAIPQALKLAGMFAADELAVVGLHTVFEHHAAMAPVSLEAFLHEYRISFPVGVDRPSDNGPVPMTMAAYGFRGTPSTVLLDRAGVIRHHGFGSQDDMALGVRIGMLLSESTETPERHVSTHERRAALGCEDTRCHLPLGR